MSFKHRVGQIPMSIQLHDYEVFTQVYTMFEWCKQCGDQQKANARARPTIHSNIKAHLVGEAVGMNVQGPTEVEFCSGRLVRRCTILARGRLHGAVTHESGHDDAPWRVPARAHALVIPVRGGGAADCKGHTATHTHFHLCQGLGAVYGSWTMNRLIHGYNSLILLLHMFEVRLRK